MRERTMRTAMEEKEIAEKAYANADAFFEENDEPEKPEPEPDFDKGELASLLYHARNEIMDLRRIVERTQAKAEAYDLMKAILLGRSGGEGSAMAIDILPRMKRMAENLLDNQVKGALNDIGNSITE